MSKTHGFQVLAAVTLSLAAATANADPPARQPVHVGLVGEQLGGGHVGGFSFGLVGTRVRSLSGVQLGAAFAITGGELRGVQVAGGLNVAGDVAGLQLAPVNVAGHTRGLQLGPVNVAGHTHGLQLGVVNVSAFSRGFHLGVINVLGEHDGEAFGLLTFAKGGVQELSVYTSDTMHGNVGLKLGTRHLYTAFQLAYHDGDARPASADVTRDTERYGVGLGLGWRVHVGAGPLSHVDLELGGTSMRTELFGPEGPVVGGVRLVAGFRLAPHLTLVAGLVGNVAVAWDGAAVDVGQGVLEKRWVDGDVEVRMYPGFVLGLAN